MKHRLAEMFCSYSTEFTNFIMTIYTRNDYNEKKNKLMSSLGKKVFRFCLLFELKSVGKVGVSLPYDISSFQENIEEF